MQGAALLLQDGLVDGVLHQPVAEDVHRQAMARGAAQKIGLLQAFKLQAQLGVGAAGDAQQQRHGEAVAEHGGGIQRFTEWLGQAVVAAQDQAIDRLGHLLHRRHPLGRDLPALGAAPDDFRIQQHAHHLFHQEWVAAGALGNARDQAVQGLVRGADIAEQVRQQLVAFGRRERAQAQVEIVAGAGHFRGWAERRKGRRQLFQRVGAGEGQDGERRLVDQIGRVRQRGQRGRIGPLNVVEHDEHGPAAGQPGQQAADGGVDAALVLLRVADKGLGRGLAADEVEQDRANLVRQPAGGRQALFQALLPDGAGIVGLDAGNAFDQAGEQAIAGGFVGGAGRAHNGEMVGQGRQDLVNEPRFADAGLAADEGNQAMALDL